MRNVLTASLRPSCLVGRRLLGILALALGVSLVAPTEVIADSIAEEDVTCPNPSPRNSPVWRNFEAFVSQEYAGGKPMRSLAPEALALALGHALGRVAAAQGDDRTRQEAVACLDLGLDQMYATFPGIYGGKSDAKRRKLYDLVRFAAAGYHDDLVKQRTGVTSNSPAYSVFGISPPSQPASPSQPSTPSQPSILSAQAATPPRHQPDGQYCATITADSGWQIVDVPQGFNGNIEVSGGWNVHHAHPMAGPEGYSGSLGSRMDRQYGDLKYKKDAPFGALLMKYGAGGSDVQWTSSKQHDALSMGSQQFQFRINDRDDALSDNKGALTVCMSVGQHGLLSGISSTGAAGALPKEIEYCEKGGYGAYSVAKARSLVLEADSTSLPANCFNTEDYLRCKKVNDLLNSALDQMTQVILVSRNPAGEGCRYCNLKKHGYSKIGKKIDELSMQLYDKGYRSAVSDSQRWHFSMLEKEKPCDLPPAKGSLSIGPVDRDDCPKHCQDAAPQCNYAYYFPATRTCSWADDQAAPNLRWGPSADIWDRVNRRWLASGGGQSGVHICKNPAIQPDAWARMYARIYGGGQASYPVKRGHLCHKRSYEKINAGSVEHYTCRDEEFADCSLKKTDQVTQEALPGGAYKVLFRGGESWWTITPETETQPTETQPADRQLTTSDWPRSPTDYARVSNDLVFDVGMGSNPKWGYGFASAPIEDTGMVSVEMLHAPSAYKHYDQNSFAGFVIDYHTTAGFTDRVMLGIGMFDTKRNHHDFIKGIDRPTLVRYIDLGTSSRYDLDLSHWAPAGWDGKVMFSVGIQNAGENNSVRAKLNLHRRSLESSSSTLQAGQGFSGNWQTSWGKMTLGADGNGTYTHDKGKIRGGMHGNVLIGTWSEAPNYSPPNDAGDVELTLSADGDSFTGRWRYGSSGEWHTGWQGKRIRE